MNADDLLRRAGDLCDRVVFEGDRSLLPAADRALDAVEAELALARGRVLHARFLDDRVEDPHELALFERACATYEALGDLGGQARARFQIGVYHQVVRADNAAAVPHLERSRVLAEQVADDLTRSYALRHLGIAAHMAGDLDDAHGHLEESTRLRRECAFPAGVAANLVGLAYVALARSRPEEAGALLDEAEALAGSAGAGRIVGQVEQARAAMR
ncbi:tetratricopeptide repeat protein [Micromonospora sp. WMMC241]|uniref:tetratricopeptide repeat protein n=1 Tax=Micromonospora sp. WMMC241 TaxID=3015159 RepID=UPI0022B687D9|nr:tetratricopeptide repeat protein [Micromonospora sp. WMMC241]MCZ7436058.1 tetratricopeptide repeat protein [Micromonospora sp. WMMC241]